MLFACAAIAASLYAALGWASEGLALAEPSFAGELFRWVKILTRESLTAPQGKAVYPWAWVGFVGVCAGLFLVYLVMLKLTSGPQPPQVTKFVFGAGALFLILQWIAPVTLSTDVFAYTIYGRVIALFGANPYVEMTPPPISPSDPYLQLFGLEYIPSWYGPLWSWISAGLAHLSGERVGLTVLLYRGLGTASALAGAALIGSILARRAPERVTQGIVFFLWNPLMVLEIGLSGHNDAVMMVLVLLGIWLHVLGVRVGAVIAFTLSTLIKFVTGMLIPLYICMVLRSLNSWRARAGFLAASALGIGAACSIALPFATSDADSPVRSSSVATDFYANNFHELIYKGIRRALGEDAESVATPIYFAGWWLIARGPAELRAAPAPSAEVRREVPAGGGVLVIAPQRSDWARVYDPVSKQMGYVLSTVFDFGDRPAGVDGDPVVQKWETGPMEWPTSRIANAWIRWTAWILFAAFGLLAAWRTTSIDEFIVWSAAAFLASYYLVITQIWPWYILWAVAVGALATHRLPAKLALLLSAGGLSLSLTIGFIGREPAWVSDYRSVLGFLLPLFLFVLLYGGSWLLRKRRGLIEPQCENTP